MAELTQNEKRLLATLEKEKKADAPHIAGLLEATPEAVVQWAHLAQDKGLVTVERIVVKEFVYTDEGKTYAKNGLPETQLLRFILPGTQLADLQKHEAFRIGFGQLRKKGLVKVEGTSVTKDTGCINRCGRSSPEKPVRLRPEDKGTHQARDPAGMRDGPEYPLPSLPKGSHLQRKVSTSARRPAPSPATRSSRARGRPQTSAGMTSPSSRRRRIPGRSTPTSGSSPRCGRSSSRWDLRNSTAGSSSSRFWNFDALFQPQDHPAREMQDTFYLRETLPLPKDYEKVKAMHLSGGETSSTGWGGVWKEEKAEQCVLRTHTTCLSIQHLAQNKNPPVKAFAVGRVYRRETIDTTHLAEFEQLEGIVMDEDVSFANLLGILREFYNRMGFESVRFKPSYYPYTEPSLDAEVYIDGIGWIEMGGAGVFREEVTAPIGINYPVLAWGLGVSRIAMLRLGLKDLRLLHKSDVAFLRETPSLRPKKGGI